MTLWLNSTILATSLVATVAVGIASATNFSAPDDVIAAKTDRLPIIAQTEMNYLTVETRDQRVSVLNRIPLELK